MSSKNFTFKTDKGIKYEILFRKPRTTAEGECDGICYNPEEKHPKILISPYLTRQTELNTIIHEMAHAFFWDEPESVTFAYANAVSRMLYNHCNWRKIETEKCKKRNCCKTKK